MTKQELLDLLASNAGGMAGAAAMADTAAKQSPNPTFAAKSEGIAIGYRVAAEFLFAIINGENAN